MQALPLIRAFALLNLLFALLATGALYGGLIDSVDRDAALLSLLMLGAIAAAMYYCTEQKIRGSDIGHKAFPACIAAYLLWILISYRWYTATGLT